MIRSFRGAETEIVFRREFSRRFQGVAKAAVRRLEYIHAAVELQELAAVPGNRLEALAGDRKGQHSIRINDQWRVCFVWRDDAAYDVEIVDYH